MVAVGDAAHPMRPQPGQGGCQGVEDAAILAAFVEQAPDLPTAFAGFAAFRRPRIRSLVRESALIGRAVNLRPAFLGAAASHATVLIPEALRTRHQASAATSGGGDFRLSIDQRGCLRLTDWTGMMSPWLW